MKRSFFLVDDDPDDIMIFCEALQEVDGEIVCSSESNSVKALEVIADRPIPDLIFLDINMPIVNGWELLDKIKLNAQLFAVPVIMYSTSSLDSDIRKARKAGAVSFFRKPTNYLELKEGLTVIVLALNEQRIESINSIFWH